MSVSPPALRVGLIGVGFGAKVHAPAFQSEGCEITAVVARRHERAEAAKAQLGAKHAFTDFHAMLQLDEIDAVAIASPPADHREMVLAALAAGKHVLCEKPFALNVAEAEEMRAAAARSGLTAMVAHEFRFTAGRMRVKELLDEGYIGAPRFVRASLLMNRPAPAEPLEFLAQRDDAEAGAGLLFALGSHYIDGLLHWLGPVASVSGDLRTFAGDRVSEGGLVQASADNFLLVTLRFESGAIAQLTASAAAPFAAVSSIELYGEAGTLVTPQTGGNPPPHGPVLGARLGEPALAELDIPERLRSFSDDRDERLFAFRLLVRAFKAGVAAGTSPAPNFDDGLRVQRVLDAVRRSAATGEAVTISPGV
ncbi:Gfo/Idh/MocA family protein [Phenylobacterium immobile]|uniref:Gfo/Idh/MocA family protein n=1 Tax=Phenylobacterium immobile TaxID=21 RepID=UPI000B0247CB|nr:Gfo/Idh/MocA family oxidoreductase [Phenylobacterium immobile]